MRSVRHRHRRTRLCAAPRGCHGVVLVITLVLLTAVALMAASTLRNAISTESVSGAVRTLETALQAAEIALRHCERLAAAAPPATAAAGTAPPLWQDLANWDGASAKRIALPLDAVNTAGAPRIYRRAPECLIEPLPIAADPATPASAAASGVSATATVVVVTARGFGPDVAAQPTVGRPSGTEIWLQSQIEQVHSATTSTNPPARSWRQLFMR